MSLRERAENDGAACARVERGGHGAMPVAHGGGAHAARDRLAGRRRSRVHDGGEFADQILRDSIRCDGKQVLEGRAD